MIRQASQTVLLSALAALVVQAQAPVITGFSPDTMLVHPGVVFVYTRLSGHNFWPSGPNDPNRRHIYIRQAGGVWSESGIQITGILNDRLDISILSQPYLATAGQIEIKVAIDGMESSPLAIQVRKLGPKLDSVSPDQILLKPGLDESAFKIGLRGQFWVSPTEWFINGKYYGYCFQHPDYGDETITWPGELRTAGIYTVQLKNPLGASESRIVELVGAPVLTGSIPAVIHPSDLSPKAAPTPVASTGSTSKLQLLNTAPVSTTQLRLPTFELKATFQGSAPTTMSWQTDQSPWQEVPVKGAVKGSEVHLSLPATALLPAAWVELRLVNKVGESKLRIPRAPDPTPGTSRYALLEVARNPAGQVNRNPGSPATTPLRTPALAVATVPQEIPPLPPAAIRRLDALMPRLQPTVRTWIQDQAQRQRGLPAPDLEAIRQAARDRFKPINDPATATRLRATIAVRPGPPAPLNPSAPPVVLGSADIEALVFVVLMQASKSAQEDLKAIMDGVKAINKQKEGLRQLTNEVKQKRASAHTSDMPCASPDCRALEGRLRTLGAQLPPKARLTLPPIATMGDLAGVEAKLKDSLDSLSEMGETDSMRLQMAMDRRSKFVEALSNIMEKISDMSETIIANL
ncbi:MAG TPA: hypothetical protein VF378_09560, partial [Geothrix sp.]